MVSIPLPFSLNPKKLSKMKFWQKRKKLEISDTDQVYKVIYLGNVVTNWAKGESTLEKPLTTLWKNYCNNYANFYAKNVSIGNGDINNRKSNQNKFQSKQILMKLTICNQGLKALTREFGLTEYWANRITFCGQSNNFPRVFAWIYRHEGKRMKQELRVHACLVNKQISVTKMINALQSRLTCALDEFKREQKMKENSRRISLLRDQFNLFDDLTPSISDEFDELDYAHSTKDNAEDDQEGGSLDLSQISISSESKGASLQRMCRHSSQSSLTSLKSKSSTSSSRKSSGTYENNVIPVRKQLLLKGSKNFKEPLERTKSAPKLCSILEELSSEDEDNFFGERLPFDESFSISEDQFHVETGPAEEEGQEEVKRQERTSDMNEIERLVQERLNKKQHLQRIRSNGNVENLQYEIQNHTPRNKSSDRNENEKFVLKENLPHKEQVTQVDTFITCPKLKNETIIKVQQLRPTSPLPTRDHQSLCERFKHILVESRMSQ